MHYDFHIGNDLPRRKRRDGLGVSPLTSEERAYSKARSAKIGPDHEHIHRIDLFVNQERYPQHVDFVAKIRALFL